MNERTFVVSPAASERPSTMIPSGGSTSFHICPSTSSSFHPVSKLVLRSTFTTLRLRCMVKARPHAESSGLPP